MAIFAVLKNNKVENLVDAESIEILGFLLPDAENVVEMTEDTKLAFIGADYLDGKFVPMQTYASWTFDKQSWSWIPPIPMPTNDGGAFYEWDEDAQQWVEATPRIDGEMQPAEEPSV